MSDKWNFIPNDLYYEIFFASFGSSKNKYKISLYYIGSRKKPKFAMASIWLTISAVKLINNSANGAYLIRGETFNQLKKHNFLDASKPYMQRLEKKARIAVRCYNKIR